MAAKTLENQTKNYQFIRTMPTTKAKAKSKKTNIITVLLPLFAVVIVPLSLSLAMIYLFGSGRNYHAVAKPLWFPPLSIIHLASVGSTFLMSLAAWLVWTNDGLHVDSEALPLYIAQISLSMVWDPLVLRIGAVWLAFVFCLVNSGTLFACYWFFGKVNPSSQDFVKPCLAWVAYLTLVTYNLMHF